jgi:hypothetical protein
MSSLVICTSTKYYLSDQIEKNEMGGACRTCEREERRGEVSAGVWWSNLRERDHLDNIKMDLQEVGWGGSMDWIHLA